MDRRSFLGSLLGTVAALVIEPKIILPEANFLALPETAEWQRLNPTSPWRMMWKDEVSGLWLQGGALRKATMLQDNGLLEIDFDFEPITTSQTLYLHPSKLRLFNDKAPEMNSEHDLTNPMPLFLMAGDTLTFPIRTFYT